MALLEDLITQIDDATLAERIANEVVTLKRRKKFGLVFEGHEPELVAVHATPRVGSRVTFRTHAESRTQYTVTSIRDGIARLRADGSEDESEADTSDLLVVKRFGDPIFPGLRSVASIRTGGDGPAHAVIDAENFHALQALTATHAGKVDVIYIDPPYNTGARDWKYNNRFVDMNDGYRRSKWLSFMEKRLKLARGLLNPSDSVLLITIDQNELCSLGLLLDQLFPACERQIIDVTISPRGKSRDGRLSQVDEYVLVTYIGGATAAALPEGGADTEVRWRYLRRNDVASARGTAKGGPRQFYPIYVNEETGRIEKIGDPLGPDDPLSAAPEVRGAIPVFPIRDDGKHMNWGLIGPSLQRALDQGFVRVTPSSPPGQPYTVSYLTGPNIKRVEKGELLVTGKRPDGSKIVVVPGGRATRPTTSWRDTRYDAGAYGTSLLGSFIPGREFPFPKSLYTVEDTLRPFVHNKPDALILDFFGGSGTTGHAVLRLNKQDGGSRRCILVTNNEVSDAEAKRLAAAGHSPGDPEWEALGIFQHVTMPRMKAAASGFTPDGTPVDGEYKFVDPFPMSDGFDANIEFMQLEYLERELVELGYEYDRLAPLLWLQAGAVGRWESRVEGEAWSAPDTSNYAVLFEPGRIADFLSMLSQRETISAVWIETPTATHYRELRASVPDHVRFVGILYGDYLRGVVDRPRQALQ